MDVALGVRVDPFDEIGAGVVSMFVKGYWGKVGGEGSCEESG